MRRRGFLHTLAKILSIAGFASLPYGLVRFMQPGQVVAGQKHIPLPGALAKEHDFVAACIGCGLCGEVCPPRCVKFYKHTEGAKANTPYIDPAEKACILCARCMEICPTDALSVIPLREIKMGIAQIDRVACYPWVDRGICGACVSICPLGNDAISYEFGNVYRPIVKQACVGCGLCVEVCPEPSLPIRIVDRSEPTIARHGMGIRRKVYE
ncbi:MAG: 4Fe-4S dicluster domain-containing protein [Gammaproteobacteria bacterium]|nr:4Fe-4S dicluster domain-containing protein [Gammaproteobacteria bacterium]